MKNMRSLEKEIRISERKIDNVLARIRKLDAKMKSLLNSVERNDEHTSFVQKA